MAGGYSLQTNWISPASAPQRASNRAKLMFAGVLSLAMVASVRGQVAPPQRPDRSAEQSHWREYINRQYAFSFWYPDDYAPGPLPHRDRGFVENAPYWKDLLVLEMRDDPESQIMIAIDTRPFHMDARGSADGMPPARRIGRHVFYSYLTGSGGVGFSDHYDMNLKGKTLGFDFGPDNGVAPSRETRQLESMILKTFRTF